MIDHDLSYCRRLQNVIVGREKTVGANIQQHYLLKVVGAQDGTKDSLPQVVESIMELTMELVVEVQLVA